MTVAAHSALEGTIGILVHLPDAVIDHKKIKPAVVVVVEPASADGPHLPAIHLRAGEASLYRDVGECAIAIIVKELVAGHFGEEDVGPSVVVVIPDCDSHAIASAGDAGVLGHVSKSSVMVIAIQPIPILR